ncbi:ribonucleoprotein PTB-binding 1-like isoform X2 [Bacillus rossius redtenbacheri]
MLEDWDKERVFLLRGQRLPVSPAPTETMLCVARLPLGYTEHQFSALVAAYGSIRRSFLMISENTGESKGYGFVEYTTKEAALLAKNVLDGKLIDGWILCCDWLESSHTTFESLHSKCLYVDQLPKDFRDMGKFRKVFSSVVNPPYCQIALKNGCPQDWGLVEFNTSEDAETTQVTLNGYSLCGQNIRVSYYIPGVRAINLYLKLLNETGRKLKSAGLLPDPPAPAVFQQLQNLAKQNPVFAQNLQNIIWTQIQSLQNGIENGQAVPGSVSPGKGQLQGQPGSGHQSLLNNHQMLIALQNLIKQGSPPNSTSPGLIVVPQQMGPPPTTSQFHFGPSHIQEARKSISSTNGKNGFMEKNQTQKVPLLPRPGLGVSPPLGEAVPHSPFAGSPIDETLNISHPIPRHMPPQVSVPESNFWNGMLGQIPKQSPVGIQSLEPNMLVKNKCFDAASGPKSPLLNDKVNFAQHVPSAGSKISGHPSLVKGNNSMIGFSDNMPGDLQQTINTILSNAQNLNQLLGSLTNAIQTNSNTCTMIPSRPTNVQYINQTPSLIRGMTGPGPVSQQIDNAWPSQQVISVSSGQSTQPIMASPVPGTSMQANTPLLGSSSLAMAAKPIRFLDMKPSQLHQPSFQNNWNNGAFFNSNSTFSAPCGTPGQFGAYSTTNIVPNLWSHPGSPVLIASPPSGLVTPIGQKRKYNRLLPSPEPSPEGNYIGQHSQGLGGHYADSYFKRKKKN